MNDPKPLDFITLREPATGRASSLSIHGRIQDRNLTTLLYIVGNLEHNAGIEPDTVEDAAKLIAWLEVWRANRMVKDKQTPTTSTQ